MQELKTVVEGLMKDLTRKHKKLDLDQASRAWERVVGKEACRHTKIVHLTKDKIQVNVNNSARLYQLNLRKAHIQKELRRALGVEEVRLKLGEV